MTRKILVVLIVLSSMATVAIGYKKLILDANPPAVSNPPVVQPVQPEPPSPEPPKPQTIDDALASVTQERLKEHVVYLASKECEGRMSGTDGNVRAAAYIKQKLESYGLPTMYDKFNISKTDSRAANFTQNVYGWIEGSDPSLKEEVVVVGAHMDHIGYGPAFSRSPNSREVHYGADDNASGTAAALALAEALSKLKPQVKRTVVFQFYSGEELGLLGSQHYVSSPKFPVSRPSIAKHVAMINLDMIGHLGKGVHSAAAMIDSSFDLKQLVADLASKYSFAEQISNFGSRNGGSDHVPFYNKGVPIVFLHTGLHAYYHTPEDTPDTLDFKGMEQVARFALDLTWKVSQHDAKIRFNYASFVELPLTHDHGVIEVPFQFKE